MAYESVLVMVCVPVDVQSLEWKLQIPDEINKYSTNEDS